MDLGLAGKIALIMGGSRGIGRAIANELAAEGCAVAIVARTRPAVDEAGASIRAAGGNAIGICADLSVLANFDDVAAQIRERLP